MSVSDELLQTNLRFILLIEAMWLNELQLNMTKRHGIAKDAVTFKPCVLVLVVKY